jgi:TATA-box binding protein (TBP) (component of TFIID and TFIIIB)
MDARLLGIISLFIALAVLGGCSKDSSTSPPTQPPPQTVSYEIYDALWNNETDIDGDSYISYGMLTFDVDVSSGTHSVYAKVYYKPSSSGSYSLYYTTSDFTITGSSSSDAHYVSIGLPNSELSHNSYDFRIEIFTAGGSTVVASITASEDSDLNDENFETSSEDVSETYTVYSAWWSDAVDSDGDGYTSYRRINFDIDVSTGTQSVYARIYYKLSTSTTYSLYYTTSTFSITGSNSSDAYSVAVGSPNSELANGTYDFRIEVYKSGSSTLQASWSATDDADLNDENFERASEEAASETYTVYDAWWANDVDADGDGYTSYRRLTFDIDVSSGTQTVYARIYYKTYTSTTYSLYFTTANFSITGSSSSDTWWIAVGSPNSELSHTLYDFYIEVYKVGSATVRASYGPTSDSDLDNESFETALED